MTTGHFYTQNRPCIHFIHYHLGLMNEIYKKINESLTIFNGIIQYFYNYKILVVLFYYFICIVRFPKFDTTDLVVM